MGAFDLGFSDLNNNSNIKSNEPSLHFIHTIQHTEIIDHLKQNPTQNITLNNYAEKAFFEKGETALQTNVKYVIRDYIYGGFKFLGKEQLGLNPDEILELSNLKGEALEQKLTTIIKNLLIEATHTSFVSQSQCESFAANEAKAFIHAHSQGPAGMIPFTVAGAVEMNETYKIQQPTVRIIDTYIFNNQLYHTLSADDLPMLSYDTGKAIGAIKGPFKATFRRVGNKPQEYGFQLIEVDTNNIDIEDIVKGKTYSAKAIIDTYQYKKNEYPHERKTPGTIAAMSTGRFITRGYKYVNSKQSKILQNHGQGLYDAVVFHTFEENGTLIHSFNPTCDHDKPYMGTIALKHALQIFKKDLDKNPTNAPQKLVVPLATGNMGRRHWLELFIEINAEGQVKATLTDSQRVGWLYPTKYIADAIYEVFKQPLHTQYRSQQAAHNFVDCGDFFLENSDFSLGHIKKPVTHINNDMLEKHHAYLADYNGHHGLDNKSPVLTSSQCDDKSFELIASNNSTSLIDSFINVDPVSDQIETPEQAMDERLTDNENAWLLSSQESNENNAQSIVLNASMVIIDDYAEEKEQFEKEDNLLTSARIDEVKLPVETSDVQQLYKRYQDQQEIKKAKLSLVAALETAQSQLELVASEQKKEQETIQRLQLELDQLANEAVRLHKNQESAENEMLQIRNLNYPQINALRTQIETINIEIDALVAVKEQDEAVIKANDERRNELSILINLKNQELNDLKNQTPLDNKVYNQLCNTLATLRQLLVDAEKLLDLEQQQKQLEAEIIHEDLSHNTSHGSSNTNKDAQKKSGRFLKYAIPVGVIITASSITAAILFPVTIPFIAGVGIIAAGATLIGGIIKFCCFLTAKAKSSLSKAKPNSVGEGQTSDKQQLLAKGKKEIEVIKKKLKSFQKEAFGYETENLANELEPIKDKIKEQIKDNEDLLNTHELIVTQTNQLDEKINNHRLSYANLSFDVENRHTAVLTTDETITTLKKQEQALLNECTQKELAIHEADLKLRNVCKEIALGNEIINDVNKRLVTVTSRLQHHSTTIHELNKNIADVTSQIENYDLELLKLEKELSGYKPENSNIDTVDYQANRQLGFVHNISKTNAPAPISNTVNPQNPKPLV